MLRPFVCSDGFETGFPNSLGTNVEQLFDPSSLYCSSELIDVESPIAVIQKGATDIGIQIGCPDIMSTGFKIRLGYWHALLHSAARCMGTES